jgi:serine/threonine-protein kinase
VAKSLEEIGSTLTEFPVGGSAPPQKDNGPRYQTLSLLGQGGMGRVEEVRDRDLLREVAAKLLRPELEQSPRLLTQFLWEARVTAHLDHPNIVPVHDAGTTPSGAPFYTMKLVRGRTLHQALGELAELPPPEQSQTLPRRLRWFLTICQAVAYAHSRGVLHRDLKPSNVMIGEYGEVLVTDWGLALPLPNAPDSLRAIVPEDLVAGRAGTASYMSPEQSRGDPLDARSDQYSLGIMLREIVSLRRSESSIADRSLQAVVKRATQPDPGARYADVLALGRDIEDVLEGRTPEAERFSVVRWFWRFHSQPDRWMVRMQSVYVYVITVLLFGAGMVSGVFLVAPQARPRWLGWVGGITLLAWVIFTAKLIQVELEIRKERKR